MLIIMINFAASYHHINKNKNYIYPLSLSESPLFLSKKYIII